MKFNYTRDPKGTPQILDTGDPEYARRIAWISNTLKLPPPAMMPYGDFTVTGQGEPVATPTMRLNLIFFVSAQDLITGGNWVDGHNGAIAAVDAFLAFASPTVAAHEINFKLVRGIDLRGVEYKPPVPPRPLNDWEAADSPMSGPHPNAAGIFLDLMGKPDPAEWTGPSGKVYEPGFVGGYPMAFTKERPSMFAPAVWRVKP